MVKVILPNDIINDTPADASPVEQNFNRIESYINTDVIERGGTVAMTAQLKLIGDPVASLDAAPKQYVDAVIPIGIIMMFGGVAAPPGGKWALCNGAEVEVAAYPLLYAVIGNAFGGTTGRFNLPNLVDRFPIGVGSLGAIGAAGGQRDTTLPWHQHGVNIWSGAESANHYHGVSGNTGGESNQHYHRPGNPDFGAGGYDSFVQYDAGGGAFSGGAPGNTQGLSDSTHWNEQGHSHGFNVNSGGVSANHAHPINGTSDAAGVSPTNTNLPPYQVVQFIIRAA